MPRIITSPVKRYPGTVTLSEPLNFVQLFSWRDAHEAAQEYVEAVDSGHLVVRDVLRYQRALLAGALRCVESHTLGGLPATLTADTFPATPIKAALSLAQWLSNEIAALIAEDDEAPKE